MQLISKFNKGSRFLLLKNKKGFTTSNAFKKTLNKSSHKPNKIWVDKWSEFYNRSTKSRLEKNDIEIYSTRNEEKSAVFERFIRTLINKIYKCMTSVSKNVYIDKLDEIHTIRAIHTTIHIIKQFVYLLIETETCWCKIKHMH